MTTQAEIARDLALAMIAKSGVREWADPETRDAIAFAALDMAAILYSSENPMAITATYRQQTGTPKVFKSSGGDGALTLASLANGAYRQSAKIDLGATFAQVYGVELNIELAATPTAGNTIDLYWNPSSSVTAGTDNKGGCSGTDAAYTGYSSNAAASVPQLQFIGSFVCTAQATTTVQVGIAGLLTPTQRYGSLVLLNGSGAAVHTSDANCKVVLTPLEPTAEA